MTEQRTEVSSARKDDSHMTPAWDLVRDLIAGVHVHDVKNVVTANGVTTELFREDWGVAVGEVRHMIHVALRSHALSAWHMHRLKTDHLFVVHGGPIKVVLYDGRAESPTHEQVDVFHLSPARPTLVVVPPGIWHGLVNLTAETACFVNFFDHPYDYEDPDDWRLPPDTPEIPYRF
jgi:dTDP-4-dehydrorhamnose 3,5-epimerase